jgi:hypothetical protein
MGKLPTQMRGQRERNGSLFSYVSIQERIPASHPLRRIRKLADQALDRLTPPLLCALRRRRPSLSAARAVTTGLASAGVLRHPIGAAAVTASKDDAPAAVQAAIVNVAGLNSSSAGGGLIQTTSG